MIVKVTSLSFSKNEILRTELLELFPEAKFNETGALLEGEALYEFVKDADVLVVGLEIIDRKLIDRCPKLRMIAKYGVGLDSIDVEYAKAKDIYIGWTGGVNRLSVAEMALGFMITTIRNIAFTSMDLKNFVWNKSGGFNLSGKTIGIIGLGHIGKELVRLLKPFECNILVNDIVEQVKFCKDNNLQSVSKEEIYKQADIITVHTPLTPQTKYLFDLETFTKMKESSILINTARGAIVNNEDLKVALKSKMILAAAMDTYEKEPDIDKELISIPNLYCTPHIGGNSRESILLMGRSAIGHIEKFFGDKK